MEAPIKRTPVRGIALSAMASRVRLGPDRHLGFLLLAELALNLLPVASGLRSMPVDAEHPVYHFEPNRSYVFSHGWRLQNVNRGRVNNAGWVNDQDYRKDDATPLLAVVGDSFIEAQMVPYAETMQARLAKALEGQFRVYSFAGSGAPLSQYLIWARHAVRDYGARAVVINVVINDFDESHTAYRTAPGFWLYAPDQNGDASAPPDAAPARISVDAGTEERARPLSPDQSENRPAHPGDAVADAHFHPSGPGRNGRSRNRRGSRACAIPMR